MDCKSTHRDAEGYHRCVSVPSPSQWRGGGVNASHLTSSSEGNMTSTASGRLASGATGVDHGLIPTTQRNRTRRHVTAMARSRAEHRRNLHAPSPHRRERALLHDARLHALQSRKDGHGGHLAGDDDAQVVRAVELAVIPALPVAQRETWVPAHAACGLGCLRMPPADLQHSACLRTAALGPPTGCEGSPAARWFRSCSRSSGTAPAAAAGR